jgi:hypothetical protein
MFANRLPLVGTSASGTSQNASATAEPGEPSHYFGTPAKNSVWWTWTAPRSEPASVSSRGSSILPIVAVYTGNVLTSLTQIASGVGGGISGETLVQFTAVAGTTYQIVEDTDTGSGGELSVNVSLDNPSIGNATISQGNISLSIQGRVGASYEIEESSDLQNWHSVSSGTIPSSGSATFQDTVKPGVLGLFYRVRLN